MRRNVFMLLVLVLAMFAFAGCGEKKEDTPPPVTAVNLSDLNTLKGDYDVNAFYTSTDLTNLGVGKKVFTSDCSVIKAVVGAETPCETSGNVSLRAQARISADAMNKLRLETKVQMWGGSFAEASSNVAFGHLVKPNSYNYTKYGTVDAVNEVDKTFQSTGVTGRNFKELSSSADAAAVYSVLVDGRILVKLTMTVSGVPTETFVLLKKRSDAVSAMNPNTLVDANASGFDAADFITDVFPTSDFSKFVGTYEVNFFGSEVTNVRPAEQAGFATMFYISNDCAKATELYPNNINIQPVPPAVFMKNGCTPESQSALQKGVIAIQLKDGKLYTTSKMEMKGGTVDISAPDKYQYTSYSGAVHDEGSASFSGTGVTGSNYDVKGNAVSATPIESPATPFEVTLSEDGKSIDIKMTLIDKSVTMIGATVDAVTRVLATKVGDYTHIENKIETDLTAAP